MELPLFPLETVLCPGIAAPLHVFEPRYRRLTERCLSRGEPFGVVLIRQGREVGGGNLAISAVGTMAEIRRAERLPDGRYELLVVGAGRFTIRDVDIESEPYVVADVAPLDEVIGNLDRAATLRDRVMRRFVRYLRLLRPLEGESGPPVDVRVEVDVAPPAAGDDEDDAVESTAEGTEPTDLRIPDDPVTLSHLFSGIVQVDALRRQTLLEADTAEDRLADLERLLAAEIRFLRERMRPFIVGRDGDPLRLN